MKRLMYLFCLFCSSLTLAQTGNFSSLTVTGDASLHSTGQIIYAASYAGSSHPDLGSQINAADASLGTNPGEILVTVPGTITTPVFLSSNHTLRLSAATTWNVGMTLSSNTLVVGSGASAMLTVSFASSGSNACGMSSYLISATGTSSAPLSNISIRDLDVLASTASGLQYSLACMTDANSVHIQRNHLTGMSLIGTASTVPYSSMSDATLNSGITVSNNDVTNGSSTDAAVLLFYVRNAVITGNVFSGASHCVQFWGGDSNPAANGAASNPRWAEDIAITGNSCENPSGAAFWGSMGQGVVISGNSARNCGDVCLDVEGSNNVAITGNQVVDGHNGGITTFYLNRNVSITGNSITSSNSSYPLVKIYNSTQSSSGNFDISIVGNSLSCTDTSAPCQVYSDAVQSLVFDNNILRNTVVNFSGLNSNTVMVRHNHLTFDTAYTSQTVGILVSGVTGSVIGVPGTSRITDNTITSKASQNSSSAAIYVQFIDFNYPGFYEISGNFTRNFPIDLTTYSNGGNAGIVPTYVVRNNIFGSSVVQHYDNCTSSDHYVMTDNYNLVGNLIVAVAGTHPSGTCP